MDRRRHRLAERRKVVGLSQEALAEALNVDRSTVARWERGETAPHPWQRPGVAEALQVSAEELDELLVLADGKLDSSVRAAVPDAFSTLLPVAGHAAGPERPPDGEVYAAALRSFRAADRQVGGGHLYATVVSYLHRDVAPGLFRGPSGEDSKSVFTAAAALTEMAGWMAHDGGRDKAAREHFVRSHDLAQIGTEHQLAAHILASMSHLSHHLAHPQEAISYAQRGRDQLSAGPRHPELEARLLALEARGLAALGQGPACAQLLGQAEAVLGREPDEPPSPWVSRFDEAALANETARSLYQLGDLHEAGKQAERIIALRSPDRIRSRAFGQLILVMVLLAHGRLEAACAAANEVVTATRHLGSYLVVRHLLKVRRRLVSQRTNATASAFLGSLDEALRERRWLIPGEEHRQPPAAVSQP